MLIYIAAPYAIGDHLGNVKRALAVAEDVLRLGHTPYVPLLNHFWDQLYPKPAEEWLRIDFDILFRCDAILRLPGESAGAEAEVKQAKEWQIPIYHNLSEIGVAPWKRFALNGLTQA